MNIFSLRLSTIGAGWESVSANFTVCRNAQPWEDFCVQPPCGQLNPAEEGMYEVLGTVFGDMMEMFSPDTFHMGGDEIHLGCWRSSQEITDWLESQVRTDRKWLMLKRSFFRRIKEQRMKISFGCGVSSKANLIHNSWQHQMKIHPK